VVSAYTAATATDAGSITIGGVTIAIAPGASLSGTGLIRIGANLCLEVVLNANGQIISSTLVIGGGASIRFCGVVTAFVAATVSTPGSISINGVTLAIAAGTTLGGQASLVVGANVSLDATLDASGQIILPSSVSACTGSTISLCGLLTSFVPATSTTSGSITIGGVTFPIAPNTVLNGQALLVLGTNVCLTADLNPAGQIIPPAPVIVSPGPTATTEICGVVTFFTPATATATGSINIGGTTFIIGVGVTIVGQDLITTGSSICLLAVFTGTAPDAPLGPGTVVSPFMAGCPLLQFKAPLATYGFVKSSLLPDGDEFLLQQPLSMTVVSPFTSGIEIFNVSSSTFGGSAGDIGGFAGTSLQGLSLSSPGTRVEAASCTDRLRNLDFEIAGTSGNLGDMIRVFLQDGNGNGDQDLARFTVELAGVRVVFLNPNVSLFLNNRIGIGAGQLTTGSLVAMNIAAGSAGFRTQLLTLTLSRTAGSPLNQCEQLGVELTHSAASGKTSLVLTDAVVDRVELPGDRVRPQLGLIAGVGGGYPTGLLCGAVCPTCQLSSQKVLTTVSAASFQRTGLAPEMIVASFGSSLAVSTQAAAALPLPTLLAGTSVQVRDSAGFSRIAPLFFVSPGQVNFQIPAGTALGTATITITSGSGAVSTETVQIVSVAPGLFAANGDGAGVAAALVLRVRADLSQSIEAATRFDGTQGKNVAVPIDMGPASDQVFLVLFGTGIRFRTNLAAVSAKVGGVDAQVTFAGPQGTFVGLDQINVRLPRSLIGRGEVAVTLTVNGIVTNTVNVNIH
jgi:uncharacterized protein (TIGR03437 family)